MASYGYQWPAKPKEELDAVVKADLSRLEEVTNHHMGYPYNLDFKDHLYPQMINYLINHLGDPQQGSQYAINAFDKEMQVVDIFKKIWGGDELGEELWGYVSSSGTENNLWAIYHAVMVQLKRHQGKEPVILCSAEGHYSFDKGAAMTRVDLVKVSSNKDGSIDLAKLEAALSEYKDRPIIVGLMSGTTVKEGHDDIVAVLKLVNDTGRDREDFYIHVDGALSAVFLPFVNARENIRPGFWHDIDSISASGHKFLGCPVPCGVLVVKKRHNEVVAKKVEYIKSSDTTMGGSRSGFVAYFLWLRLHALGSQGITNLALKCIILADEVAKMLRARGVDVLLNPKAITLYFPKPSQELIDKYSLACEGEHAHIIVTPNTLDDRPAGFVGARKFAEDYLQWRATK